MVAGIPLQGVIVADRALRCIPGYGLFNPLTLSLGTSNPRADFAEIWVCTSMVGASSLISTKFGARRLLQLMLLHICNPNSS